MLGAHEKPDVRYEDVGGLDAQKQEIREAVELPLTQVSAREGRSLHDGLCSREKTKRERKTST